MVSDGIHANARADRLIEEGNAAESAGRIGDACELYRKAVAAAPHHAKAHLNLGIGLEASGETDGAIASFETAHALDPTSAPASYNLGRLLYLRGALSRAEGLLRLALEHRTDFPQADVVLASVYEAQDKHEAAATQLESALAKHPDLTGVWRNYGLVLRRLGRSTAAEEAFRRALSTDPGDADAHFALADLLDSQGDYSGAAASLELALTRKPDWAQALNDYGLVLQRLHRLDEAERALRRAIAVAPELSNAYRTLGAILVNQCRVSDALEVFRQGRERDPQSFDLESAELFALNLSEDVSCEALYARHQSFGIRVERAYPPRFEPLRNVRDPERRLRVGYVSGDFGEHAVTLFTLPLIERHDRSAFEIYCYSTGTIEDDQTRNVQSRTDVWRPSAAMSPMALADLIHSDRIDILIDLSGHSGTSSLVAFAQQPAPVQATWLGYLNTTGLTRIRYRICDRYTDPPEADALHTETLMRLPNSQWCYRLRPALDYAGPPRLPCRGNGFVTFGSFNHAPKISGSTRRLWASILHEMPDSRLMLVGVPEGRVRDDLLRDFADAGIEPARLSVLGRVGFQEYFRGFNAVDLALDTTPYSGGTTTCDALWMGVPVLTVPGCRPVSRSTAGILSVLGLDSLIASSPADYVQRAASFARAKDVLADLHASLRGRMQASALMDEDRFTRDIEAAYRHMWRRWCDNAAQE